LMEQKNINGFYIPILISTFFFGLEHLYSLSYMINGLFMGFVFAYSYCIIMDRKENPLLIITIIHSLVNFVPFCRDVFFI
jgi:membrane protease YdiL (CAAX protease family)